MFRFSLMDLAIDQAVKAELVGEVPVGAVISYHQTPLSFAHNMVIANADPTAHAEILAIRQACELLNTHILAGCSMYVTLEPCAMCAKAISLARISKLYFGAYDFKTSAVFHGENMLYCRRDMPEVIGGVKEQQCSSMLTDFFIARRKN